jgi:KRAB domain-containing zinc finger protein
MHSCERPYTCDVSKNGFNHRAILIQHQRLHTGERLYLCEVCNKTFSQQSHVRTHKPIHSGERRYKREGIQSTEQSDKTPTHA